MKYFNTVLKSLYHMCFVYSTLNTQSYSWIFEKDKGINW